MVRANITFSRNLLAKANHFATGRPALIDPSSAAPLLSGVSPRYAAPGGRLLLTGRLDPARGHAYRAFFGDSPAQVAAVRPSCISVIVPEQAASAEIRVELNGVASQPFAVALARTVASDLHPVANPVFDGEGNLLVTFSGQRGEKVPVSIFLIDPARRVKPFLTEIVNPTGLAFDRDGDLYVSSRHEGSVYRVRADRRVDLVADELGIATGLAFDPEGILYVGDRQGTIFRIEPNGEPRAFCHPPPSVSAYHLVFDEKGFLYVSGPSLSSVDSVYRVSPEGKMEVFCTGFGRPQGMAFDLEGNLYLTEALVGDSGLYRITPDGQREFLVAGPPLVGLAFDGSGGVLLAGNSSIYFLELGVIGRPLHPRRTD
jgi:sugar lactone lactonase YvrE